MPRLPSTDQFLNPSYFSDGFLGLKTDPSGLTWYLIQRSLQKGMLALVDEAWLHRIDNAPVPPIELAERLDSAISKAKLEVSVDFFRQPRELPFLEICTAQFHEWLVGAGFDQPKAKSISSRLVSYFVYALNQEWRAHPDLYAPIVSATTTPFTSAGERERAWEQYRSWLDQELDSPLFGEPFSLRQLYVPLRAYYIRSPKGFIDIETVRPKENQAKRVAIDLTSTLIDWVKRTEKDDAIRIISGGPGSGKSSIAKMFTAIALAQTNWRAIYIPLHRIKYKGEIISALHDYLRDTKLLPGAATPLDNETGETRILLIFDGLDELAMLGKVAQETANGFVRAVKDFVRDQNTTSLRVKVILTGRTVVMQSLESEFRGTGVVLHLCPYFVPPSEEGEYERGWKLLSDNDQREKWWSTYGELTGRNYIGLPDHFNRESLIEVSSEPLLNYLLALADQAHTLDFTKEVTENHIYASLIHEVYDRRWSDGQHFSVQGMSEDHFQRVLEEVAVAAWHGDGRKTTVGEIKQHCQDAGIMRMLDIFQDGAESGVLRLLTAFFFRQAGVRADENAFEFTHKSFGEYLVARRLVRLMEVIEAKTEEQRVNFSGWDERESLEKWAKICGPTALNPRQWGFLRNEMHRLEAKPIKWQPLLASLVNILLRRDFPMERLGLIDYRTMRDQSRNAEESLLAAINACALVTRTMTIIDWPEVTSAGAWIKILQGQRLGPSNVIAMSCMSWINMDNQILPLADAYRTTFANGSFIKIDAQYATLMQSNFENANLKGAHLAFSNLSRCRLINSNLEDAYLEDSNLEHADLRWANLKGANLKGADLREADLRGANLQGADLRNTNLYGADFRGIDLEGINLNEVDIAVAVLKNSDREKRRASPRFSPPS